MRRTGRRYRSGRAAENYDIIVIGSGIGGLSNAALIGSGLPHRAPLISAEKLLPQCARSLGRAHAKPRAYWCANRPMGRLRHGAA